MAGFLKDRENEILNKLRNQKQKIDVILKDDPSLLKRFDELKDIIREMSLDIKQRKEALGLTYKNINELNMNLENRKNIVHLPRVDSREIHETKVKQLGDLEEALRLDGRKLTFISGVMIILIFLQVAFFVFM
jgi:hypothetical protein